MERLQALIDGGLKTGLCRLAQAVKKHKVGEFDDIIIHTVCSDRRFSRFLSLQKWIQPDQGPLSCTIADEPTAPGG